MHELAADHEDGMPTRREFGRRLAAAAITPLAAMACGGASSAGSTSNREGLAHIPEDTYPFFTDEPPVARADLAREEAFAARFGNPCRQ